MKYYFTQSKMVLELWKKKKKMVLEQSIMTVSLPYPNNHFCNSNRHKNPTKTSL